MNSALSSFSFDLFGEFYLAVVVGASVHFVF